MADLHPVRITVNGVLVESLVAPRTHLADFVRETLSLTGTHLGCEHGVCGACTIELNGKIVRSCLTLAVQANGGEVRTIEGLSQDQRVKELQEAFIARNALQCGFCTPGMLITARDIVLRLPELTSPEDEARIRNELSGNLCRCTGYQGIVQAIQSVLRLRAMKVKNDH